MSLHCSESNTPLSISKAEFMAYQTSVSTTTSSATSTSTATSASTGAQQTVTTTATSIPSSDDDDGLSSAAKIGIIAGSAAAGVALLAAAVFFFIRHRRRQKHQYDEVHPMLATNTQHDFPHGGPGELSADPSHMSVGPSELESAVSTMRSSSPNARNTWQSSSDGNTGPWSPGSFDAVKASQAQTLHRPPPQEEVYEMPADSVAPLSPASEAAEMPAISVTSPTISPSSRYSGLDWAPEQPETRRYEPFRPR